MTLLLTYLILINFHNNNNVDWFPTLELGHSKLDVAVVHAASERASKREARAKERNKRVFEMNSNISTSQPLPWKLPLVPQLQQLVPQPVPLQ